MGARFELFGGPTATNVGRLSSGPAGWIITGNRSSGAAVWLSPDAAEFEILEGAPVLSSSPGLVTWASDAAGHNGEWIVVGGTVAAGRIDRDAAAWRSQDGSTWTGLPAGRFPGLRRDDTGGPAGRRARRRWSERLDVPGLASHGRWLAARRSVRVNRGTTRITGRPSHRCDRGRPWRRGWLLIAAVNNGSAHEALVQHRSRPDMATCDRAEDMPSGAEFGVAVTGVPGSGDAPDRILLAVDDGTGSSLPR